VDYFGFGAACFGAGCVVVIVEGVVVGGGVGVGFAVSIAHYCCTFFVVGREVWGGVMDSRGGRLFVWIVLVVFSFVGSVFDTRSLVT